MYLLREPMITGHFCFFITFRVHTGYNVQFVSRRSLAKNDRNYNGCSISILEVKHSCNSCLSRLGDDNGIAPVFNLSSALYTHSPGQDDTAFTIIPFDKLQVPCFSL